MKAIHITAISHEMPQPSITKIRLKVTCIKFHSNFPGANELINFIKICPQWCNLQLVIDSNNSLALNRHQEDPIHIQICIPRPQCINNWAVIVVFWLVCSCWPPFHSHHVTNMFTSVYLPGWREYLGVWMHNSVPVIIHLSVHRMEPWRMPDKY